jgi:hypothetical protein
MRPFLYSDSDKKLKIQDYVVNYFKKINVPNFQTNQQTFLEIESGTNETEG